MFIPDPRWEEPNLLIPGKKPTGPVVIDLDHAIGGDMLWYWPGQSDRLIFDGTYRAEEPTASAMTFGATPYGLANRANSTSGYFYFDDARVISNINRQSFTFFVDFIYQSNAGSRFVFGNTHVSGAGYNWGIYISAATPYITAFLKTSGVGSNTGVGVTLVSGGRYTVVATYDGSTLKQFTNGSADGSVAKTGDVDITDFDLGFNAWQSLPYIKADYISAGIINRALPDSAAAKLSSNPYQFLVPA